MVQVPGAQDWFNNIEGIIEGFVEYGLSEPGSWISVVDASILEGIQDGYAYSIIGRRMGVKGKRHVINDGADEWQYFFNGLAEGANDKVLIRRWGAGEEAVTAHGRYIAEKRRNLQPNGYEQFFLYTGDLYRSAAKNLPGGLGTAGQVAGSIVTAGNPVGSYLGFEAGRFFNDPRSQVPVVGRSPVYWYSIQIWRLQEAQ